MLQQKLRINKKQRLQVCGTVDKVSDERTSSLTNEVTESKTGSIHATEDRKAKEIGVKARETKSHL
jgi:hypothetical protein